jgi:hypothetical protein
MLSTGSVADIAGDQNSDPDSSRRPDYELC